MQLCSGLINLEWPHSLQKALSKLWGNYEESKQARTKDNLEQAMLFSILQKRKGN